MQRLALPAGLLFALMASQGAALQRRILEARSGMRPVYHSTPSRVTGARRDGTWRGRWIGSMKVSRIGKR